MLASRPTPLTLFQDNENNFLVDGKTINNRHKAVTTGFFYGQHKWEQKTGVVFVFPCFSRTSNDAAARSAYLLSTTYLILTRLGVHGSTAADGGRPLHAKVARRSEAWLSTRLRYQRPGDRSRSCLFDDTDKLGHIREQRLKIPSLTWEVWEKSDKGRFIDTVTVHSLVGSCWKDGPPSLRFPMLLGHNDECTLVCSVWLTWALDLEPGLIFPVCAPRSIIDLQSGWTASLIGASSRGRHEVGRVGPLRDFRASRRCPQVPRRIWHP